MKKYLLIWCITAVLGLTGCVAETTETNNGTPTVPDTQNTSEAEIPPGDQEEPKEPEEPVQESEDDYPRFEVPLVRVIDGDTIKVKIDGKEENIRFLLVDTPETNHPRMDGPQPFGPEAKKFMEELLQDAKVEIELDVSERDHYGRILAYVYADGVMAQEKLLENGLARVAYIFPPNTRYVDQFQVIQQTAQAQAIGIWSVENYAQEDGFYPEHVEGHEPQQEGNDQEGCLVKGNISSSGEKIYHVKTGAFYDRTIAEECFDTEAEAEAAGYRKSKR